MQRKKAVNNSFKTEDFALGSKGSNVSKKKEESFVYIKTIVKVKITKIKFCKETVYK